MRVCFSRGFCACCSAPVPRASSQSNFLLLLLLLLLLSQLQILLLLLPLPLPLLLLLLLPVLLLIVLILEVLIVRAGSARLRFARFRGLCAFAFRAGSARVVLRGFCARRRIQISYFYYYDNYCYYYCF